MATTSYTDSTFSLATIGNRTDPAGNPVSDFTAEEARFLAEILTGGYLKPAAAFQVRAQDTPNMSVRIGSGTAKSDYYVIEGQVGGQGNYVVRLDVTSLTVPVPAADASQPRTDEVYLVVRDNAYDASARGLPQIGYRRGDLGGAAPGLDSSWDASALLATIPVPALETAIENVAIGDERIAASLLDGLAGPGDEAILRTLVDAKGDLIAGTATDTVARLAVGANGQVLTADSAQAAGVRWAPVGAIAGAAQSHVGASESTTATTDTNLATPGPAVTVNVGTAGIAIVFIAAEVSSATSEFPVFRVVRTGANFGSGDPSVFFEGVGSTHSHHLSRLYVMTGLNPGSTTFTMKYRSTLGGSVRFADRHLGVVTF